MPCVRLLAAVVCEQNLEIFHLDTERAFVNSEMGNGHDVYMGLPKGCESMRGLVVKLAKSLYGLKQATRQWHAHLRRYMLVLEF